MLHGREHVLMQADLNFYPPIHNPNTGFVMTLVDKPASAMEIWPGLLDVQVPVKGLVKVPQNRNLRAAMETRYV